MHLEQNSNTAQDHTDYTFKKYCPLSKVNLSLKILTLKSSKSKWVKNATLVSSHWFPLKRGNELLNSYFQA